MKVEIWLESDAHASPEEIEGVGLPGVRETGVPETERSSMVVSVPALATIYEAVDHSIHVHKATREDCRFGVTVLDAGPVDSDR